MVDPEALTRDELVALVRDQAAQLADQAVELQRLRAELEQIKRLISPNNGDSSMPPSTDGLPGRVGKRRPAGGGQPGGRGKQPGAPGAHLPWLDEADVLLIVQHVPVHRCVRLVADLAGAGVSAGFVHKMLAAAAVAEVVKRIKTLITLAAVVHFDQTTLRAGNAGGATRYV